VTTTAASIASVYVRACCDHSTLNALQARKRPATTPAILEPSSRAPSGTMSAQAAAAKTTDGTRAAHSSVVAMASHGLSARR